MPTYVEKYEFPFWNTKGKKASLLLVQVSRFCVVGGLNTGLDLLMFNLFLFLHPTQNSLLLLGYNSLAYFLGATNSFCWNKWWTFREKKKVTRRQLARFGLVTTLGIGCNDAFLWLISSVLISSGLNNFFWTNCAKVLAIGGSFLVSYLGMHFGVFRRSMGEELPLAHNRPGILRVARSLSVVLPAYNEEATILTTLTSLLSVFQHWNLDFEVLVVDDGSRDQTAARVLQLCQSEGRVKLLRHLKNRGYGDALRTGFSEATKELTFFMDSDGQFDIRDLAHFFPLIEEFGAVLGYRIERRDTWLRKLNAWGWKQLVAFFLGIRVRDLDCAFKLFRTSFFRAVTLESGGAMINAEILYKLARTGYTCTEVGVVHLPRQAGKATGAKLSVILRAIFQLFYFAEKWHKEEQQEVNAALP